MTYGKIIHEPKANEMSRSTSCTTSEINDLSIVSSAAMTMTRSFIRKVSGTKPVCSGTFGQSVDYPDKACIHTLSGQSMDYLLNPRL